MEKLLGFASLNSPSKIICFLEKLYRAFDTDETPRGPPKHFPLRVVFSTLFSVFHIVMKRSDRVSCMIYYVTISSKFI